MTVYSVSKTSASTKTEKLTPAEQELKVLLVGKKGATGAKAPKVRDMESRISRITKDPKFAFVLTHVLLYTGLGSGEDGAFYRYLKCPTCKAGGVCEKSNPCWAHFGYGRSVVDARREKMETDGLGYTYNGWGNRTYWRTDFAAVVVWLDEHDPMGWASSEERERAFALARNDGDLQSGSCEIDTPECEESTFQSVGNQHSQYKGDYKENPKETAESKGDDSHLGNDFEVHEEAHDRVKKNVPFPRVTSSPRVSELPTHVRFYCFFDPDLASEIDGYPPEEDFPIYDEYPLEHLLDILEDHFAYHDIEPLSEYERLRYGREIATIFAENEISRPEYTRIVHRVIYRSAAHKNPYRLSPLQAYEDEVAGKAMPPEVHQLPDKEFLFTKSKRSKWYA